jgi:hypothetical protein
MPTFMFGSRLGAILMLVAACALTHCEPRIEEPIRPSRTTAAESQAASIPAVSTDAMPAAKRCLRPTPESPARTYDGPIPAVGCPDDPGPKPALALGAVRFPDVPATEGSTLEVGVEIARRDEDRQRGLMYRTSMAKDAGMLFVFEEPRELSFWMKNTCIPLDMLFIDEDGTIVSIQENVPTLTQSTFTSGCPARFVLEVNAGWTRQHGVKAGQKVTLPPI